SMGVEFDDNNTAALVATAAFETFGYYRAHLKSGYVQPTGNVSLAPEWSGSPPTYTTLGLLLNSYWLKPTGITGLSLDGSGYVLAEPPAGHRADYEVWDRYPIWLDSTGQPVIHGTGLALVQDYLGRLHVADVSGGNIRYAMSDRAVPPYAIN